MYVGCYNIHFFDTQMCVLNVFPLMYIFEKWFFFCCIITSTRELIFVGWFVGRVKQNLLNGFHGWRMGIFKFRVDGAILQLQNSTDLIKHL